MTTPQDSTDHPSAMLPLPPVLKSPSARRLLVIQLAPTGLLFFAAIAMMVGIIERTKAVLSTGNFAAVPSVLGGFPIMVGLIGAVFVTLAMRQRTRARRERARFRREARWDPCELPSDVKRLDVRGRQHRRELRSIHREHVASIAKSLGEARATAAASYERYGNVCLCFAAALALIGWIVA